MKQILLIDDEEHMMRLLRFALKPLSAQIHCINRGEAAVNYLRENSADLVLLDYSMPELDGVSTLRKIRELDGGGEVKVIMLTARDQTVIRKDAAGLNVEAFLTKPFSPSDLVRRVRELLD